MKVGYWRLLAKVSVFCVASVTVGASSEEAVVARLGTTDITVAELQGMVQSLDPAVRQQAAKDTQFMNRLVRTEIERMAVLQEAKAQKWDDRAEVAAQIARARDQVIATTFLAAMAAPAKDFPTSAEIQAAYDLNRDKFMLPRQYDLQQIFIAMPAADAKAAQSAAEKKAQELAHKAKVKGADFAALARKFSEHAASAERGGEMGWAAESQVIPEIRAQIEGMAKNEVSDAIRAGDGWHIVRLVDTKPAAPRPLADVKDSIVAALRQRQEQINAQTYIGKLLDKAPISVNEMALRKIFETKP
jgi:peptidylprolyl isomerase